MYYTRMIRRALGAISPSRFEPGGIIPRFGIQMEEPEEFGDWRPPWESLFPKSSMQIKSEYNPMKH